MRVIRIDDINDSGRIRIYSNIEVSVSEFKLFTLEAQSFTLSALI